MGFFKNLFQDTKKIEQEKHNEWYNSLSEDDQIEVQYKNWFESTSVITRENEKMRLWSKAVEASQKKIDALDPGVDISVLAPLELSGDFILTPLERRIKNGSKQEQEIGKQAADERVQKLIAADKERLTRLSKLYNEEQVERILNKQLWLGMTEGMLLEVKGKPQDISESVSGGSIKKKYFYGKSKNRLGNDSYDFEVSIENDIVNGWKDRKSRGTRDI
jgi:hypothetical protein